MKTPEDEAFEDIERKQGAGGFHTKQDMTMHKTQDQHICRHYKQWQHCHICDLEAQVEELKAQEPARQAALDRILQEQLRMGVYGPVPQPAQEPEMLTIAYQSGYHDGKQAALAGREWNFCERCGKRTPDMTAIHTCTPPQ